MALPQAKQDKLAAFCAGLSLSKTGWSAYARAEAFARLSGMGLPDKRDEYWRYTDPTALTAADAQPVGTTAATDEAPLFSAIEHLKLVFNDGVFDSALSDDLGLAGVEIDLLSRTSELDIHWARESYATLEKRGQSPVPRPLAALNSAFATEGLLIRVTAKVDRPISIVYVNNSITSDAMLHHCIKLEAGAALTLLENGPGAARFNTVMEVDLADGANFHHVRAQGRTHERHAATHIFARLAAAAVFKSFTVTANGALTRNEAVIELLGDDAIAHVAGAAVGDGKFLHDDTVFITHAGQRCESRQVFKKVLKNGAVGVFQGKILVKQGAQKTDGYQISQSLMLDDDSQFLAKPELEIYADDVKCSHGSTSGAIDDTALFYLRSRGVPLKDAQSLLVLAFLAEAIAEIEDDAVAEDIRSRLEGWLSRHGG